MLKFFDLRFGSFVSHLYVTTPRCFAPRCETTDPEHIFDFRVGPLDLLILRYSQAAAFKAESDRRDEVTVDLWKLQAMFTYHRKETKGADLVTTE